MKWIAIGGFGFAGYLWWLGGASTSNPLASFQAGWQKLSTGSLASSPGAKAGATPTAGAAVGSVAVAGGPP